jgi:hypothetical protein
MPGFPVFFGLFIEYIGYFKTLQGIHQAGAEQRTIFEAICFIYAALAWK